MERIEPQSHSTTRTALASLRLDLNYKKRCTEQIKEYTEREGQHPDFATVGPYNFWLKKVQSLEKNQQKTPWPEIVDAMAKLSASKRRINDLSPAFPRADKNTQAYINEIHGPIDLRDAREQLPHELRRHFQFLQLQEQNELLALCDVLEGASKNKPSELAVHHDEPGFMLVSHPDRVIRGIHDVAAVAVNWQYRDGVQLLAKQYPHMTFVAPEHLEKTLKGIVDIQKKEASSAVSKERKPIDLDTPEGIAAVDIPLMSQVKIEQLSFVQTMKLIEAYKGMPFLVGGLDSYVTTPEAKLAIKEVIHHTTGDQNTDGNVQILHKKLAPFDIHKPYDRIDVGEQEKVLALRQELVPYIHQYLLWTRAVLGKHLFPSEKFKKTCKTWGNISLIPRTWKFLLETYLDLAK